MIMTINYSRRFPTTSTSPTTARCSARSSSGSPNFLDWWGDMGPEGSHGYDVYLRTAVSVDPGGWAHFDYVKMPDYRWGIFLDAGRQRPQDHFGEHKGEPVWQDVPGEHRANLRRIIVTQGDTEPASVEQQRHLG